jgi:hypothetical protein
MKKTNKSVKPAIATKVTKEEMAARLNGMDAEDRVSKANQWDATDSNLVIMHVCYAGDVFPERRPTNQYAVFTGAVQGYRGAAQEPKVFFYGDKPIYSEDKCGCTCCGFKEQTANSGVVEVKSATCGYRWLLETNMPHATFDVTGDGGAKYCRGIVFEVPSIPFKKQATNQ